MTKTEAEKQVDRVLRGAGIVPAQEIPKLEFRNRATGRVVPPPEVISDGFDGSNVREFTEERDKTHGDAWKVTGQVMTFIAGKAPVIYMLPSYMILPWMNILMKLMRILWSPKKRDNWFDIIGYVDLVLREMDNDKAK